MFPSIYRSINKNILNSYETFEQGNIITRASCFRDKSFEIGTHELFKIKRSKVKVENIK